jgi:hypothetical protein
MLDIKITNAIERQWDERVKSLDIKRGSKEYYKEQAVWFAGVCTAIHCLDPEASNEPNANLSKNIPPFWIIYIMTSRDITGERTSM